MAWPGPGPALGPYGAGPGHAMTRPGHAITRPGHAMTRPGHAITRPGHADSILYSILDSLFYSRFSILYSILYSILDSLFYSRFSIPDSLFYSIFQNRDLFFKTRGHGPGPWDPGPGGQEWAMAHKGTRQWATRGIGNGPG